MIDQTTYETRRKNLKLLFSSGKTTTSGLNLKLGRAPRDRYLYAISQGYKDTSGRAKSLSAAMARKIEAALGLQPGFLDIDPDSAASALEFGGADGIELSYIDSEKKALFPRAFLPPAVLDRRSSIYIYICADETMQPAVKKGAYVIVDISDTAPAPGAYLLELQGRKVLRELRADLSGALQISAPGIVGTMQLTETAGAKILGRALCALCVTAL